MTIDTFFSLYIIIASLFLITNYLFLFYWFYIYNQVIIDKGLIQNYDLSKVDKENLVAYHLLFFLFCFILAKITNKVLMPLAGGNLYAIVYILSIYIFALYLFPRLPSSLFVVIEKKLLGLYGLWLLTRFNLFLEHFVFSFPYIFLILIFFSFFLAHLSGVNLFYFWAYISFIFRFFFKVKEILVVPVVVEDGYVEEEKLELSLNARYPVGSEFIRFSNPQVYRSFSLSKRSINYIQEPWLQRRTFIGGVFGSATRAVQNSILQYSSVLTGLTGLVVGIPAASAVADTVVSGAFSNIKDSLNTSSSELNAMNERLQNNSIADLTSERRKEAGKLIRKALDEKEELSILVKKANIPYTRILELKALSEANKKSDKLHSLTKQATVILSNLED